MSSGMVPVTSRSKMSPSNLEGLFIPVKAADSGKVVALPGSASLPDAYPDRLTAGARSKMCAMVFLSCS